MGYLDDLTLGGTPDVVHDDLVNLRAASAQLGLSLNDRKCEVVLSSPATHLPPGLQHLQHIPVSEATLLGVPLLRDQALNQVLAEKVRVLGVLSSRLPHLEYYNAITILRHSLALPSLQHLLRGIHCHNHPEVRRFDSELRSSLSSILNVSISDCTWTQASLPIKAGGLGIRQANQVAPSAYLAASHNAERLASLLLSGAGMSFNDSYRQEAAAGWSHEGGTQAPTGENLWKQRAWDSSVINNVSGQLLSAASDDRTAARLRASSAPHSGDWLSAPPLSAAGLRMSNEVVRVAAGLRLGTQLCGQHTCQCGEMVDTLGSHGLSCRLSSGRITRHTTVNDLLHRALNRAGLSAVKEPDGLSPGSSLRPDGVTLVPWARGRCMAWDFTSPDTLAASHLSQTSTQAGSAAERAGRLKEQKYSSLLTSHVFIPVAVETLGAWNDEGERLIRELGRRLTAVTGDPREASFLFQRISVAAQRGNAAAVLGSLPKRN